jgi:hypothetical protein
MADLDQALSRAIADLRQVVDALINEQKEATFHLFDQDGTREGAPASAAGVSGKSTPKSKPGAKSTAGPRPESLAVGDPAPTQRVPLGTAPVPPSLIKRGPKTGGAGKVSSQSGEHNLQQRLEALKRNLNEKQARDRGGGTSSSS